MCRTSGCANTASSAAIVMSHASEYQKPPPITQPWTAAITGFERCQMWSSRWTDASSPVHQRLRNSAGSMPSGSSMDFPSGRRPMS